MSCDCGECIENILQAEIPWKVVSSTIQKIKLNTSADSSIKHSIDETLDYGNVKV